MTSKMRPGMLSLVIAVIIAALACEDNAHVVKRKIRELWRKTNFTQGADMFSGFNAGGIIGRHAFSVVPDPAGGPDQVLRVFFPKGSYSRASPVGVVQFYAWPTAPQSAMMFSYDVYFSNDFDFVRGGKLPGLWGGRTNTCSALRRAVGCFSTRFMWRSSGAGEVYAYLPEKSAWSLGRGKWYFRRGQWQNIAQYIHLNTPGSKDGYIKVFMNREQVFNVTDVTFRTDYTVNISGIFFSTFFGGKDPYWAATRDSYIYFKNFVLSTGDEAPILS